MRWQAGITRAGFLPALVKMSRETKWDRKLNDELSRCLECGEFFDLDTDIQLCQECMKKFDVERLWKLHDNNELNALDFNESKKFREKFRK